MSRRRLAGARGAALFGGVVLVAVWLVLPRAGDVVVRDRGRRAVGRGPQRGERRPAHPRPQRGARGRAYVAPRAPAPDRALPRSRPRTLARRAALGVVLVLAALWLVFLRPASLGGPATYVVVSGESMRPALQTGDLVVALKSRSYDRGDVVVFRVPRGTAGGGTPVIHRVVSGSAGGGFVLRGDNRQFRDPWLPTAAEIDGKAVFTVPGAGLVLVFLRAPLGLGLAAGLLTFLLVAGEGRQRRGPRATILARA